MIETLKSKATQKFNYTAYIHVIVVAWMQKLFQVFQRNYRRYMAEILPIRRKTLYPINQRNYITLYCDVRPDV